MRTPATCRRLIDTDLHALCFESSGISSLLGIRTGFGQEIS
jgi:hypothetical protein